MEIGSLGMLWNEQLILQADVSLVNGNFMHLPW